MPFWPDFMDFLVGNMETNTISVAKGDIFRFAF